MVNGSDPKTAKPAYKLPKNGTLVLGHNFSNVKSYHKVVKHGGEMDRPGTWPVLISFLITCGISLEECFFTNAFMGLMETNSSVGTHEGHRDPNFREACKRVLAASIEMQQPRLILTLGPYARRFLGEVVEGLEAWRRDIPFWKFDEQRLSEDGLDLRWGSGHRMSAVSLVHPSAFPHLILPSHRRRFGEFIGYEAEVELVKAAKAACGLP